MSDFFWIGIASDIKDNVKTCDICKRREGNFGEDGNHRNAF